MSIGNYDSHNIPDDTWSEEKDLLVGIIVRAVRDLKNKDRTIRVDAKLWLKNDEIFPFSFMWICEKLNIEGKPREKIIGTIQEKIKRKNYEKRNVKNC